MHTKELIHTLTPEETLEVERNPEEWRKQQIDSVSVKVAAHGQAVAEETPEEVSQSYCGLLHSVRETCWHWPCCDRDL